MHSWASSLRTNIPRIRVYLKSISTLPRPSRKSKSEYHHDENKGRKSDSTFSESLLRSASYGVAVAAFGSSLGLCEFFLPFGSGNSYLSYADSGSHPIREPEKKTSFLFKDAYRRKVFFKYEKRIRTGSPPEKVFEYFASFKAPSGEAYMTPSDLMRAVVAVFPPSEANAIRGGYLKGELVTSDLCCPSSLFFMLFDMDNDGLISFPEYIFFVTILSIPESSFSVAFKMFDLDNDGGIDQGEFKKVMSLMRTQNRQGASHRDGKRIGLKVSRPVEDGGLLKYFFGKDGNQRLEHDKFVQFLRDLHDEMLRLEFVHYDYKSCGTISAKDFVLSMVASANMSYINRFLDQADELKDEPSLRDLRITFEEFKNFANLRRKLEPFSLALFSYGKVNGLLSKHDFKRAAEQVCGISLTDKVVDLVFYMFDANRDGSLSSDEFLRVLERRETDISQAPEGGFAGLISCWLDCSKNCFSKKKLV